MTSILDTIERPHRGLRKPRTRMSIQERIERSTERQGDCWIWTGRVSNSGYGQITVSQAGYKMETFSAHRASFEVHRGRVPEGMHLDHLCRNRTCANPDHLEPVTARENVMRSPIAPASLNAIKTHCPHGHAYDEENTYRLPSKPNYRYCRTCMRDSSRKRGRLAHPMKRTTVTISAAALALALTGCGFAPTEATDEPPSSSSTYTPDDALVDEPATDEPTAELLDEVPEDMGPVIAKFGEDWEYEDGMTVKVTAPTAFTPSPYAAGGEGFPSHVRLEITLTNGTSSAFDPTLAMDSLAAAGAEGDPVFDTDAGLEGSPMSTLLPGKSVTWTVGYGVQDTTDMQVEVTPDFDYEPAIFTADGN